jgi:hypothetical protein
MPATAALEGAERVRQGRTPLSGSSTPRTGRPVLVRQPREASFLPWQEHTERRLFACLRVPLESAVSAQMAVLCVPWPASPAEWRAVANTGD